MRKKALKIASILLGLGFVFGAVGCDTNSSANTKGADGVGITKIEKTSSEGRIDTYTIYYSDGTTSTFTVTNGLDGTDGDDGKDGKDGVNGTNGEDGQDGTSVTVEDLYLSYIEETGQNITYEEFLDRYLNVTVDDSSVNRCLLSSVKVYCEFEESDTDAPDGTNPICYTGGGVVYEVGEEYTYLLTNYHVAYDIDAVTTSKLPQKVHCYLYGSEGAPSKSKDLLGNVSYSYGSYAVECEYVGGEAQYDVAVLRVSTAHLKALNPDICAVTFANDYYVGQTAYAIGNPHGDGISLTRGVVSVESEYIDLEVDETVRSYRSIRMDTPLYSGNSGGGLFNAEGELIGLCNAGKKTEENINFAIPFSIVKGVTENVLTHANDNDVNTNDVHKLTLGVTVSAVNSKFVYDEQKGYGKILEEVTVSELAANGIAKQMGLSVGDILTEMIIEGISYPINRIFSVGDALLHLTAGTEFSFTYTRAGEKRQSAAYTVQASDLVAVS